MDLSYEPYASTCAVASTSALDSGPSLGRRSAVRARRTILEKTAPVRAQSTVITKAIQGIKRNRKNRHAKLREMTREDEAFLLSRQRITSARGEIVCPVCLATVQGDEDVQDAHVQACIATESQRTEEERERREVQEREEAEEVDVGGADDDAAGYFGDVRGTRNISPLVLPSSIYRTYLGTGFHTRNRNEQDVDDEIDIDGDDAEVFGSAQFNEADVLDLDGPPIHSTSARTQATMGHGSVDDPETERDQPTKVLRELIAESRASQGAPTTPKVIIPDMDKVDVAIMLAKRKGDSGALMAALENKIKLLV